ncbi:carbon-nitrogen hydrolase family protein [Silvimonas iriomotensis]|uniref:Carbon-nitrogen hydrolase n=1 Tax=Silvimonas iriomotensis TaxID=449662 RepID=A0ABQ2PDA3_9NEIS|nr:carbon-nitrogen hydrolase family protein [Silvimonas iriomotensis]GGP23343.1 carbon-nitrogen hydrolase [Silvimonas iriomotensis]
MQTVVAAAVQMISTPVVSENLALAGQLIAQAAAEGAQLIAVPEYFAIMGQDPRDKIAVREQPGSGPIQDFLASTAAKHGIWLIGGTAPLVASVPDKVRNSTLVYDPNGKLAARYDKIHLFGFTNGDEHFAEAETIEPGDKVTTFTTPFGRVGLSICYDLRFPELFRAPGEVDFWFLPSAFTATTGKAHWEPLIRARAIENQCYFIAPGQGGLHPTGRETHGHSMIVDPWGQILAQRENGNGVAIAELKASQQERVRKILPALKHRVL